MSKPRTKQTAQKSTGGPAKRLGFVKSSSGSQGMAIAEVRAILASLRACLTQRLQGKVTQDLVSHSPINIEPGLTIIFSGAATARTVEIPWTVVFVHGRSVATALNSHLAPTGKGKEYSSDALTATFRLIRKASLTL